MRQGLSAARRHDSVPYGTTDPAMAPVETPCPSYSPSGACTSAADDWWTPLLRLPGGTGGAPGISSGTCGPSHGTLIRGHVTWGGHHLHRCRTVQNLHSDLSPEKKARRSAETVKEPALKSSSTLVRPMSGSAAAVQSRWGSCLHWAGHSPSLRRAWP
jgi:hypothetical protein